MYLNKVMLIGNLTRDPELKSLPSGQKVCAFSIATNEVYKKDGVKKETVEFHNCIAWSKTAENIAQYMRKGSQIYIEGKLQTRSWEKDGVKQYRTEIVALQVQFGAKRSGESSGDTRSQADKDFDNYGKDEPDTNDPTQYPASGDDINPDDIPF